VKSIDGPKSFLLWILIGQYRQLQILEVLSNQCVMHRALPVTALGGIISQFLTSIVCIRLHDKIQMPDFLLFPALYFDCCILILLLFTVASLTFVKSKRILSNWKMSYQMKRKYFRKSLYMLTPLKIKFGGNFVDQSTPLVIQNFCLTSTASLLLLSREIM
jgi:hypothetical protein